MPEDGDQAGGCPYDEGCDGGCSYDGDCSYDADCPCDGDCSYDADCSYDGDSVYADGDCTSACGGGFAVPHAAPGAQGCGSTVAGGGAGVRDGNAEDPPAARCGAKASTQGGGPASESAPEVSGPAKPASGSAVSGPAFWPGGKLVAGGVARPVGGGFHAGSASRGLPYAPLSDEAHSGPVASAGSQPEPADPEAAAPAGGGAQAEAEAVGGLAADAAGLSGP